LHISKLLHIFIFSQVDDDIICDVIGETSF